MWQIFVAIGLVGGVMAGFFGVGGGIVIVPALIYLAGFSQHQATGTSLAVLLPPIGLGAAMEYYRHGNVNVQAAVILAFTMFVGSWVGAFAANKVAGPYLRLMFGVFVWGLGTYLNIWRVPPTRLVVSGIAGAKLPALHGSSL